MLAVHISTLSSQHTSERSIRTGVIQLKQRFWGGSTGVSHAYWMHWKLGSGIIAQLREVVMS